MGAPCRSKTRNRRPLGSVNSVSRCSSWRASRSPAPGAASAAAAASAASWPARARPAHAYSPPAVPAAASCSTLRRPAGGLAPLGLLVVLPLLDVLVDVLLQSLLMTLLAIAPLLLPLVVPLLPPPLAAGVVCDSQATRVDRQRALQLLRRCVSGAAVPDSAQERSAIVD